MYTIMKHIEISPIHVRHNLWFRVCETLNIILPWRNHVGTLMKLIQAETLM